MPAPAVAPNGGWSAGAGSIPSRCQSPDPLQEELVIVGLVQCRSFLAKIGGLLCCRGCRPCQKHLGARSGTAHPGGQSEDFLFRGIDVGQDDVDWVRPFRQEHQGLRGVGRLQHVIAAFPQELRQWVPKQNVGLKNEDVCLGHSSLPGRPDSNASAMVFATRSGLYGFGMNVPKAASASGWGCPDVTMIGNVGCAL